MTTIYSTDSTIAMNPLAEALTRAGIVPATETATTSTEGALEALHAAIVAATEAKVRAEAEAKARAARMRTVVTERNGLLRQVIDLGATMADAQTEYDRRATPLAEALKAARTLGDLVPAEVVNAAAAELDTLRDAFNTAQAARKAELRRLQARVATIEEGPAYRTWLDYQAERRRLGLDILAGANKALNARDFRAAETLAAKVIGLPDMPDEMRHRAERFIDVMRYRRDEADRRQAERAERKRRRKLAKWFAAAEAARQAEDFIISLGRGQFAHLRPSGRNQWVVVSALGYEPPKRYSGSLPKRARRRVWRQAG